MPDTSPLAAMYCRTHLGLQGGWRLLAWGYLAEVAF